jgi:hypothetical protein
VTKRGVYGQVFCLESDGDGELTSRSSVRPMLESLQGLKRIEYVHKDVGTRRAALLPPSVARRRPIREGIRDVVTYTPARSSVARSVC